MEDTLLHSEHYRGFQVEVMQTPDSDLWEFGYYYCVYDEDGIERLDGNSQGYEPKDFLNRDANDALRTARWMIDRYWLQGERWHISDEERLLLNLQ
jgi:hypothetical protein